VCWCEGRKIRSSRAPKLGARWLESGAAGVGIRVRLYTPALAPPPACDWNCWISIAVMFELRCSKFELFCSKPGGSAQDKGAGGGRTTRGTASLTKSSKKGLKTLRL